LLNISVEHEMAAVRFKLAYKDILNECILKSYKDCSKLNNPNIQSTASWRCCATF